MSDGSPQVGVHDAAASRQPSGLNAQVTRDDAIAALARGATVLTGTPRLARRVLGDEAIARTRAGERVWVRGDALGWAAWLKRLHADALAAGVIESGEPSVLLTAAQADAVWQRILENDRRDRGLLQPAVAARHAAQAHALCIAWRLDRGALLAARHLEDVDAFLTWSDRFERTLADNGWLVSAQLPDRVTTWLQRAPELRPRALYLAGFDVLTPQQQRLFEQLQALDVTVQGVQASLSDPVVATAAPVRMRLGCPDPQAEMAAAARWARARLEAQPDARLVIIVPELEQCRAALARELDAVLDPPVLASCIPRRRRPWNMSLGWPLADEPLVHDALTVLRASGGGGRMDFADVSRLLRSPFLGGADSERDQRLALERFVRDRRETRCAMLQLQHWAADSRVAADGLASRLAAIMDAEAATRGRRSTAAWAGHFASLLKAMGWPGERGLDSREHQALAGWQELLAEFAALAAVSAPLDRRAALHRLRRMAAERIFQPESPPAPVQVLGLSEAPGLPFDGAWLLGMDDETWPPAPRPNPFIPADLQRAAGIPQASAAGQLAHAERVTAQLLDCAPEVIVSWPRRRDDRNQRISPLLAELAEGTPARWPGEMLRATLLSAGRFEYFRDGRGPAAVASGVTRGGAGVFRDQSQCPFRAFAVHRLDADALPTPVAGLDAMDRGLIVHRLLQALWQRLKTRGALAAMDTQQRASLLASIVDTALQRATQERPLVYTPRFVAVERQRLLRLLEDWIGCELAREDFRVIARESPVNVSVEAGSDRALTVRARIDRIDELADGRRVLVDYKTGGAQPGRWLGIRPEDPQMPLYAGLFGEELAGIVYGLLRVGQCQWHGVTRENTTIPGARSADEWRSAQGRSWDELRTQWRAAMTALADAFLQGEATVDPLPRACDYCHLAALCRVDEQRGGFARDPSTVGQDDER